MSATTPAGPGSPRQRLGTNPVLEGRAIRASWAADIQAYQWVTMAASACTAAAAMAIMVHFLGSVVNLLYMFILVGIAMTVACYCMPENMQSIMSMPETFRLENNFGTTALELQAVTYEAYHTTWCAQTSHHTFLTDSILWGALSWQLGPVGPCALVAFGFLQGRSFQVDGFARLLAAFWLFCVGAGFTIHLTGNSLEIASFGLVAGALLKVIGHAIEPVPPGILAPTFAPLDTAKVSDLPKLAASMFAGYFAEFFSGLPWRLPAIWLYIGLLHWTPFATSATPLGELQAQAVRAHRVTGDDKLKTSSSWDVIPSYDSVVGKRIANVYSIAAVAMLVAALNLYISVELIEHLCCLPPDIYAGLLFVLTGMLIVAIVDPACLAAMFIPTIESHPFDVFYECKSGLQVHFTRAMCALNWSAGYGVLCAATRISVANRLDNYSTVLFPTQEVFYDLATGELELNALLRNGTEKSWENKYGLMCAFYFYGVLSALVISRAIASRHFAALKITVFVFGGLCMAIFAQFFTKENLPATAAMLSFDILWVWHLVQRQLKDEIAVLQSVKSNSEENDSVKPKSN